MKPWGKGAVCPKTYSRNTVYWGQHLWARGYWVCTSGSVTDEMWMDYIANQTPPEPDDNFDVT
ncbi:transposase [Paracoccus marinaquae]|uniref:Transposase n=1 Tax=Paracoccus marinaquae TaxID=2841926 RepID=A0ABS6ART7_9RHOB|nr:transposase [Paracoccus marinaquae]